MPAGGSAQRVDLGDTRTHSTRLGLHGGREGGRRGEGKEGGERQGGKMAAAAKADHTALARSTHACREHAHCLRYVTAK